jgi:hypothetical protein
MGSMQAMDQETMVPESDTRRWGRLALDGNKRTTYIDIPVELNVTRHAEGDPTVAARDRIAQTPGPTVCEIGHPVYGLTCTTPG